uniref:Seipin n=1 Tax=Daucus carota subsp. sativus TaxID=79200 RepID=A0A162B8D7_DAUCS
MEQDNINDSKYDATSNDDVTAGDSDGDNRYCDAADEFPFYDCTDFDEINRSIAPESSVSESNLIKRSESDPDLLKPKLRRRRTFSRSSRSDDKESGDDSAVSSLFDDARLAVSAKKFRFLRNNNSNKDDSDGGKLGPRNDEFQLRRNVDDSSEVIKADSVVTNDNSVVPSVSNNERTEDSNRVDSQVAVVDNRSSGVLFMLACFVISAIGFQISRRCKDFVIRRLLKLFGGIYGRVSPMIFQWVKEQKYVWKLGFRFGWGMLWSFYVCIVLVGIFVSAFVISGFLVSVFVEEPVHIKHPLNFDYTKPSPVALVPVLSCPDDSCGVNCREKIEIGKLGGSRVIPPKHKMEVIVSLTLPESDYNRNLGIFQVRVDLLSAEGFTLSSLRQHSMLHFRSEPVRLLLTFFKIAPLLAGLYSETQVMGIRFRGFTEKNDPTSCIKVIMEQRAEFKSGAGIPEVYDASLSLQSELPLLRRLIWYWKKTIFIWLSMTVFTTELLLALLCCSPLILPRRTRRGNISNIGAPQNASPVQF